MPLSCLEWGEGDFFVGNSAFGRKRKSFGSFDFLSLFPVISLSLLLLLPILLAAELRTSGLSLCLDIIVILIIPRGHWGVSQCLPFEPNIQPIPSLCGIVSMNEGILMTCLCRNQNKYGGIYGIRQIYVIRKSKL